MLQRETMRKNIILLLVIAPFFSGCGTELDLDRKSATELCVEAHMAARASEHHLAATDDESAQLMKKADATLPENMTGEQLMKALEKPDPAPSEQERRVIYYNKKGEEIGRSGFEAEAVSAAAAARAKANYYLLCLKASAGK